jgi:hypothetical protein
MKTIYLIKSLLPFLFLPIAPGVVQVELERHGLVSYGNSAFITVLIQLISTVGIISWAAYSLSRRQEKKEFLRMSCVSKKVYYQEQWMTVEHYLAKYHNIVVSHGMTPEESTAWIQESEEWLRQNVSDETGPLPAPTDTQALPSKKSLAHAKVPALA